MNTTKREMTPELIEHLDSQIKKVRESTSLPCLSNYQTSASKANFKQIQDNCGPAFIDAGSNAGGFSHYCYYKNKNEEMYVLEFYCQECVSFYRIKDVCSLNGPMFGERTSL
jgi:hypothetical protein